MIVVHPLELPTFQFDQFAVKSLLVQAVEHVVNNAEYEQIAPLILDKMSYQLNDLIGLAVQSYDSPPSYPFDFDFKFESIRDPRVLMRVVDNKTGNIVLEWEN